jgi:hypothetical protein
MTKKSKKVVKKKKKAPENKALMSKIKYLNVLIACSLKQVKGDESVLDSIFKAQAKKLQLEVEKLKEKQ